MVVDVGHSVYLKNLAVLSTEQSSIANLNGIPEVFGKLAEKPIERGVTRPANVDRTRPEDSACSVIGLSRLSGDANLP